MGFASYISGSSQLVRCVPMVGHKGILGEAQGSLTVDHLISGEKGHLKHKSSGAFGLQLSAFLLAATRVE